MKRTDFKSISQIIHEHINELDRSGKLGETKALVALDDALGNGLSQYINDKYMQDGTLFIKVSSSVLRCEILSNRSNIIRKLNDAVGSTVVRDIRVN